MADPKKVNPANTSLISHTSTTSNPTESLADNPSQSANRVLQELREKFNIYHDIANSDKEIILQSLEKLSKTESTGSDFYALKYIEIGKACDWIETRKDALGKAEFVESTVISEDRETTKKMLGFINKMNISSEIIKQRVEKLIALFGHKDQALPTPSIPSEEEKGKAFIINPHTEIDFNRDRPIYCNRIGMIIDEIIWKGKIKSTGAEVSIKIYRSKNEEEVRKYEREGKIMQFLHRRHPVFLDYYGMFYESIMEGIEQYHLLYLVTEYCECSLMDDMSLRTQFQQYYINDGSYYTIVLSLLEGFIILEELKIYHQNIKPHNIFLAKTGQLKIADFSNSTFDEAPESTCTNKRLHAIKGTKIYMAPELQTAMDRIITEPKAPRYIKYKRRKADVYSLGLTFLQLYFFMPVTDINRCTDQDYMNNYLYRLQPPHVAIMLKGMLAFDPKFRFSFKNAIAAVPTSYSSQDFSDDDYPISNFSYKLRKNSTSNLNTS
ncbi:unnamed protein product [Blepharisma stoltei]|uniref:Protein kinase domain-containing protein n=1 Tax=Blepharisma stoltei TaxID=1481888 RepID=A0AAU9KHD4_9CILI|nr:unnamed protein product [Blepharisma stoltei]